MATNVASRQVNKTSSQTPEQVREAGEVFRYEDTAETIRNRIYLPERTEGYRWVMNAPLVKSRDDSSADEIKRGYEQRGYDVIVHETAVDIKGALVPNHRGILIRARDRGKLLCER